MNKNEKYENFPGDWLVTRFFTTFHSDGSFMHTILLYFFLHFLTLYLLAGIWFWSTWIISDLPPTRYLLERIFYHFWSHVLRAVNEKKIKNLFLKQKRIMQCHKGVKTFYFFFSIPSNKLFIFSKLQYTVVSIEEWKQN